MYPLPREESSQWNWRISTQWEESCKSESINLIYAFAWTLFDVRTTRRGLPRYEVACTPSNFLHTHYSGIMSKALLTTERILITGDGASSVNRNSPICSSRSLFEPVRSLLSRATNRKVKIVECIALSFVGICDRCMHHRFGILKNPPSAYCSGYRLSTVTHTQDIFIWKKSRFWRLRAVATTTTNTIINSIYGYTNLSSGYKNMRWSRMRWTLFLLHCTSNYWHILIRKLQHHFESSGFTTI